MGEGVVEVEGVGNGREWKGGGEEGRERQQQEEEEKEGKASREGAADSCAALVLSVMIPGRHFRRSWLRAWAGAATGHRATCAAANLLETF